MSYDAECYCQDLPDDEQCVFCEMEMRSRLTKLAHNLAWAASLHMSFWIGVDVAKHSVLLGGNYASAWWPNANGKAAP